MAYPFGVADAARAQTWNPVIAETFLGTDYVDIGHDRRWNGLGGFSVDRRNGAWYDFATVDGGYSAVRLVLFLRESYSRAEAVGWVQAFLAAHPGTGPAIHAVADDDASELQILVSATRARAIQAVAGPLAGTDGERYLILRGLAPPYPCELKWLADARPGEGAIVIDLIGHGRLVGVLLTYIDALGCKSVREPNRRRFNLERDPGAVMRIATRNPGVLDMHADTWIIEGLENGLSLACVRRPGVEILALPGIGALANLEVGTTLRAGARVLLIRDGKDAEESPARKGEQRGLDYLLNAGLKVGHTDTPAGQDANSILQPAPSGEGDDPGAAETPTDPSSSEAKAGLQALQRLVAKQVAAALSLEGKVIQLAGLPETAYQQARRAAAKAYDVRVGYLDKERDRLRLPDPDAGVEDPEADGYMEPEDLPWDGPRPKLRNILDNAVAVLPRFLIAPDYYYDVMSLWSGVSYLAQSEQIALPIMPQIAYQSLGRKVASRSHWRPLQPSPIAADCGAPIPRPQCSGGSLPSRRQCVWSICTRC
jgi:hypothetical protein